MKEERRGKRGEMKSITIQTRQTQLSNNILFQRAVATLVSHPRALLIIKDNPIIKPK